LELDLARRLVTLAGQPLALTPTEYELLRLLATNAGKVLTHRQILKQIWGGGYVEQPHVLRVNISNLRHKLEKDASRPRYILTESGVGYRFRGEG
jgi:two-component system KDP operon response regulator KdpE